MNTTEQGWRDYLATFHNDRPAIIERLLGRARISLRVAVATSPG
jgi:hypothetical protein